MDRALRDKVFHVQGVHIASFIFRNSQELLFLPSLYTVLQEYTKSLVEAEISSYHFNPFSYTHLFLFPGQTLHQQEDIDEMKTRIKRFCGELRSSEQAWQFLQQQFLANGYKDFALARSFALLRVPSFQEWTKDWTSWDGNYKPVLWEIFHDIHTMNKWEKRIRHQRLYSEFVTQHFQLTVPSKLCDKYLRGNCGYGVEDVVAMMRIADRLMDDSEETFHCYRSMVNQRYFAQRKQGVGVEASLQHAFKVVQWVVEEEEEDFYM